MPRKRVLDRSQVAIAKALYETEGLTLAVIGTRLGCTAPTVAKELREAGVQLRRPGRPGRPEPAAQGSSGTTQPATFEVVRSW
jgi:hypothetical protein